MMQYSISLLLEADQSCPGFTADTRENLLRGPDVEVCGKGFGLADSRNILELARAGGGGIMWQTLPRALPTCRRGREVA
jgi:hypothetical protein